MQISDSIPLLLLVGLSETWLVHFQLSRLMKRNHRHNAYYLLMLLIYFLVSIYDAANNFQVYYVFMIAYVLITITAYLFYEGSNSSRLGISFVCIALNYSATFYSFVATWAARGLSFDTIPVNYSPSYITQLVLTVMVVLFTLLIYNYGKVMSNKFIPMMITSFLIPFFIFFLVLKQYYLYSQIYSGELMSSIRLTDNLVTATLLFLTACMLYSLNKVNDSLTESLSYSATLEQMLAVQEKYYTDLQKHQQELRRINHDIKSHTRTMVSLVEQGQYEELAKYAYSLQNTIESMTAPVTNCDNLLINALLNDKLGKAKQDGVELRLCVMVPPALSINNVDICILLGNLLDNAAEACAQMGSDEERFIDVDIRLASGILCVDVSNTYNGQVSYRSSTYFSTKDNNGFHGIGLSNVRQVVSKYGGKLEISHENNVFRVSAYIAYMEDDE